MLNHGDYRQHQQERDTFLQSYDILSEERAEKLMLEPITTTFAIRLEAQRDLLFSILKDLQGKTHALVAVRPRIVRVWIEKPK